MSLESIRRQDNLKTLLRGKSGRGKTRTCAEIALLVSREGNQVLYIDTEAEGSTTILQLVDEGEYQESDADNIEYVQVYDYQSLMNYLEYENQVDYDLVVVDTLDHKHTYALRKATDTDNPGEADWNQYPVIYGTEKKIMEQIRQPKTNMLCSIDPDSGKMDKPKGCQTNIHGDFTAVFELTKDGDSWSNICRNFVGRSDVIGASVPNLPENLAEKINKRCE